MLVASACGTSDDSSADSDDACRSGQRLIDAKQSADDSEKDRQLERLEDLGDLDDAIDLDEVYELATDSDPDAADDLAGLFIDGFDCDIDVPDAVAVESAPVATEPAAADAPAPSATDAPTVEPEATLPVPTTPPGTTPTPDAPPATEPATTDSAAPTTATDPPAGDALTPAGTALAFGEQGVFPVADSSATVGVTVESVELAPAEEIALLDFEADEVEGRDFYYVRLTVENLSDEDLSFERLHNVVLRDDADRAAGAAVVIGFEPCESAAADSDFLRGSTYQACSVSFLATGTTSSGVTWAGEGADSADPIRWS